MFVDAWGWLALGYRRDPHHDRVNDLFEALSDAAVPQVTTDYVLDEVITRLYRRETPEEATGFLRGIFSAVEEGHLRLVRVTAPRFERAWGRRQRWLDKPDVSFTDLTSMIVMEELGLDTVVSDDDDLEGAGFTLRTSA